MWYFSKHLFICIPEVLICTLLLFHSKKFATSEFGNLFFVFFLLMFGKILYLSRLYFSTGKVLDGLFLSLSSLSLDWIHFSYLFGWQFEKTYTQSSFSGQTESLLCFVEIISRCCFKLLLILILSGDVFSSFLIPWLVLWWKGRRGSIRGW